MHDATLLQALLDHPGLRAHERQVFASMAARRADGRAMSFGQRSWAQDVGARLKIPGVGRVGYVPEVMAHVPKAKPLSRERVIRVEAEARATSKEIAAYRRMMSAR